jgi:hypothetical protein
MYVLVCMHRYIYPIVIDSLESCNTYRESAIDLYVSQIMLEMNIEMHIGHHVKCLILLPSFNRNLCLQIVVTFLDINSMKFLWVPTHNRAPI